MYTTGWATPTFLIASVLLLAGCEFSNSCGDRLLYDEPTNQCVCPPGSEPDADRNGCVLPSGEVIPWAGFDVPYLDDAGRPDMSSFDAALDMPVSDTGPDIALRDVGPDIDVVIDAGPDSSDTGPDAADAGPPPGDVRARFPWNGFTTGSIHVPEGSVVVNHPLRPKLMWEAVDDADAYQVQMTRECDVSGFRDCAFGSPELDETTTETTFRPTASLEVARIRPVGSRYFWRVRACSAGGCSGWTEIRYIDVGRDPHDFDGDGYADLVVGAAHQSRPENQEGNVYVYFGNPLGIASSPDVTMDNPEDHVFGGFGWATAAGDLNADGYADLVIVAVGLNGTADGGAYVYLGGSFGPRPIPSLRLTHENLDIFTGRSVAIVGDVHGDGFADLTIGAPGNSSPAEEGGCVYLFPGNLSGVESVPSDTICNPIDQPHGLFGVAVAGMGDLNGDGFTDIAVGADRQSSPEDQEGNVYVYFGAVAGPAASPSVSLDNPDDDLQALFGSSLALGDLNADGFADLIVGADARSKTYVFLGLREVTVQSPT